MPLTVSALGQVMVYGLIGAKPLPESMANDEFLPIKPIETH